MKERRVCTRCVLPESAPDITLDARGVCSVCRAWDVASQLEPPRTALETDFTKLLNKHRGKGPYDCLVMCSGGKDSTSSLYYMKERYKLRPLAFMFDHGFETEDAEANVRQAVEKLDIDFLFFRSTFMHDMFARILRTGSKAVLCHVCSIWYMDTTFDIAARYDIPIIIAGWTKGQSTNQAMLSKCACNIDAPEFAAMGVATRDFIATLKGDPKYGNFPTSMEEVLKRANKRHKAVVLSPHWFLPYDTATYVAMIQRELGWKYPSASYPGKSTNCYLNFVAAHNSLENFGYTHYHVEMSKQIRQGLMTRDEALKLLEPNWDVDLLNRIVKPLGHTFKG